VSDAAITDTTNEDAASRASGSSFYAAMRILPRAQRQAMFEIYSFCRAVDDIADDPGDRDIRRAKLEEWRRDIDAIYRHAGPRKLHGLAEAIEQFGMRREDFQAVIDGMEMDVRADIRAPDLATLELYCDRVASAVGRLSVRVFGMEEADGVKLAHHLGRALQLTNILRDLDEDAAIGRLYLPREGLEGAGIDTSDPVQALAHDKLAEVCMPIVARTEEHFREADAIMKRTARRLVRAPRIMGEAYKGYLYALIARGWRPPRERVRLSRTRILWIVLRYAFL
jgi:presqualene diphosphate synthase